MTTKQFDELLQRSRQLIHSAQECESIDHKICVLEWQRSICDALESLQSEFRIRDDLPSNECKLSYQCDDY